MKTLLIILLLIFYSFYSFAQNEVYLNQQNGIRNAVTTMQIGYSNIIKGFSLQNQENIVKDMNGNTYNAAYQKTISGNNTLTVLQQYPLGNGNSISLFQSASTGNIGNFIQTNGENTVTLYQLSENGSNEANIKQENGTVTNNLINIIQTAIQNNTIPNSLETQMTNPLSLPGIYQSGLNNKIVGASLTGNTPQSVQYNLSSPAEQNSQNGSNRLEIWQDGNDNTVGLHQTSKDNNTALIDQKNDNNTISLYQINLGGSNLLEATQTGGMNISIYQTAYSGTFNKLTVVQNK